MLGEPDRTPSDVMIYTSPEDSEFAGMSAYLKIDMSDKLVRNVVIQPEPVMGLRRLAFTKHNFVIWYSGDNKAASISYLGTTTQMQGEDEVTQVNVTSGKVRDLARFVYQAMANKAIELEREVTVKNFSQGQDEDLQPLIYGGSGENVFDQGL